MSQSYMRRVFLIAVLAMLIVPTSAQAWIVPLFRAWPYGNTQYGYKGDQVPEFGGLSSNLERDVPWFQATVGYGSDHALYAGCRGHGSAEITVWAAGRSGTTICRGVESWRLLEAHVAAHWSIHARIVLW